MIVRIFRQFSLVIFLFIAFFAGSANAIDDNLFNVEVDSSYSATGKNVIRVNHNLVVNNSSDIPSGSEFSLSTTGYNLRNLQGSYQDGIGLDLSVGDNSLTFGVDPRFSSLRSQWSFNVSYEADIYDQQQDVEAFYIPPVSLEAAEIGRNFITLTTVDSLGKASFVGLQPDTSRAAIGSRLYSFELIDNTAQSGFIAVFTEQIDFEFSSTNDNLILPGDTSSQKIFLDSLESEKIKSTKLDQDFNILTGSSKSEGFINSRLVKFDLDKAKDRLEGSTKDALSEYLSTGGDWQSYEIASTEGQGLSDLETIEGLLGNVETTSTDFNAQFNIVANFTVSARAAGIPARIVIGDSYQSPTGVQSSSQAYAWSEVFLEDLGWIPVDVSSSYAMDSVGQSNPLLVAKVVWGVSSEKPDLANLLSVNEYEPTIFDVFDGVDNSEIFEAQVNRNTIIPFLVYFNEFSLTAPKGNISDQNAIKSGSKVLSFGSTAPLSRNSKRAFSFGSSKDVSYGIISNGQFEELYRGTSSTSYTYFVSAIALILLILFGSIAARKRNNPELSEVERKSSNFKHPSQG